MSKTLKELISWSIKRTSNFYKHENHKIPLDEAECLTLQRKIAFKIYDEYADSKPTPSSEESNCLQNLKSYSYTNKCQTYNNLKNGQIIKNSKITSITQISNKNN